MISRRTVLALAEVYAGTFYYTYRGLAGLSGVGKNMYAVDRDELYDFLYAHDHSPWFCNAAKNTFSSSQKLDRATRKLKEFIMKLHTGETQLQATPEWTWEQRQQLGQLYLLNLAEDILNYWTGEGGERVTQATAAKMAVLLKSLELDGYSYRNSRLLVPESDVLEVEEETGILRTLYQALALGNEEMAFHHLALSEEHYLVAKWDDSIANARKFLECVLREVAATHSSRQLKTPLPTSTYERPARVRDYLEREGLLEKKEREAIASVYGLLSETGGHPYMARNEQARLLRHLALTFAQFVLLRLQGVDNHSAMSETGAA